MWSYIAKRLLLGVVTIYGVATLVFFLMRIVPGDALEGLESVVDDWTEGSPAALG